MRAVRFWRGTMISGVLGLACLVCLAAPAAVAQEKSGEPASAEKTAQTGVAAGSATYPPQAGEVLPAEFLDTLEPIVVKFLRLEDYQVLVAACPGENPGACLKTPQASTLVDKRLTRAVIVSAIEMMDVEMPERLTDEDFEALAERCADPGKAWAGCTLARAATEAACYEKQERFGQCLVDDDLVRGLYLEIRRAKKEAFGDRLFIEFSGLLAALSLEDIKLVRSACPGVDRELTGNCFSEQPAAAERIKGSRTLAEELVEAAEKDIRAARELIDTKDYIDRVSTLILTIPLHRIAPLTSACEKASPELKKLKSTDDLDAMLTCVAEGARTDPFSNPTYTSDAEIRNWLGVARTKVIDVLTRKERTVQQKNLRRIAIGLGIVAGIGFLGMLFMPLGLERRAPNQAGLWASSFLAAIVFAITFSMLGASLLALQAAQAEVSISATSPKLQSAEGAFAGLERDRYIGGLSRLSRERLDSIKVPLRGLFEGARAEQHGHVAIVPDMADHWTRLLGEPELRSAASNAEKLDSHASSLGFIMRAARKMDWLLGIIPIFLMGLAVLLYLAPFKGMLGEIASALPDPAQSASHRIVGVVAKAGRAAQPRSRHVARATRAMAWAELKSIVPFLLVLVVFLAITGFFLAMTVRPLMEILVCYSLRAAFYVAFSDATTYVLYLSLGALMVLFVMCIALYVTALIRFIGKTRKLLRSKFHYRQPFMEHGRFFGIGSLSILGVLLFPVAYAFGLEYVSLELLTPSLDGLDHNDMVMVPVVAVLAFPVLFWAARGFKALGFVTGYQVATSPVPRAESTPPPPKHQTQVYAQSPLATGAKPRRETKQERKEAQREAKRDRMQAKQERKEAKREAKRDRMQAKRRRRESQASAQMPTQIQAPIQLGTSAQMPTQIQGLTQPRTSAQMPTQIQQIHGPTELQPPGSQRSQPQLPQAQPQAQPGGVNPNGAHEQVTVMTEEPPQQVQQLQPQQQPPKQEQQPQQPQQQLASKFCGHCGKPARWVAECQRSYCDHCQCYF